jgi:hypothetical protein
VPFTGASLFRWKPETQIQAKMANDLVCSGTLQRGSFFSRASEKHKFNGEDGARKGRCYKGDGPQPWAWMKFVKVSACS